MTTVKLVEITKDSVRDVIKLDVGKDQDGLVAPNSISLAQAHFEPGVWFRAIKAGDTFVGFVQILDPALSDEGLTEKEKEEVYLWRFMIDANHQKNGYGAAALDELSAYARTRPGVKRIVASFVPKDTGPEGFYMKYGFEKTGNIVEGEVEISLDL